MAEHCENCGGTIGNLETPHLWNERVVCARCWKKLSTAGSIQAESEQADFAASRQIAVVAPPVARVNRGDQSIHYAGTPNVAVAVSVNTRGANGFGVASLVIGIIGALTACVPFTLPISGIGLILGIVGIISESGRTDKRVGLAIAGTILSAIGPVIWLMLFLGLVTAAAAHRPAATSPPVGTSTSGQP